MADNCLIDADLPEAVKQWNATYAFPKLIIAGAKEILNAYESRYANIIPSYKGDFTEFWTDGLGSDAKRVALSQHAKEKPGTGRNVVGLVKPKEKGARTTISGRMGKLIISRRTYLGCAGTGVPRWLKK